MKTITHRPVMKPDFSFEEWCTKKGIPVPKAGDLAMAVMGMSGYQTKRTKGIQKKNLEKMSEYSRIYNEYLKDLTYTKVMVPLDLTKETDMAYLRVMHKRQLRRMKCQ